MAVKSRGSRARR